MVYELYLNKVTNVFVLWRKFFFFLLIACLLICLPFVQCKFY